MEIKQDLEKWLCQGVPILHTPAAKHFVALQKFTFS